MGTIFYHGDWYKLSEDSREALNAVKTKYDSAIQAIEEACTSLGNIQGIGTDDICVKLQAKKEELQKIRNALNIL